MSKNNKNNDLFAKYKRPNVNENHIKRYELDKYDIDDFDINFDSLIESIKKDIKNYILNRVLIQGNKEELTKEIFLNIIINVLDKYNKNEIKVLAYNLECDYYIGKFSLLINTNGQEANIINKENVACSLVDYFTISNYDNEYTSFFRDLKSWYNNNYYYKY